MLRAHGPSPSSSGFNLELERFLLNLAESVEPATFPGETLRGHPVNEEEEGGANKTPNEGCRKNGGLASEDKRADGRTNCGLGRKEEGRMMAELSVRPDDCCIAVVAQSVGRSVLGSQSFTEPYSLFPTWQWKYHLICPYPRVG